MRGKQLIGSQRLRCAVSILNYFPNEVLSFPLILVCLFRGRNVLKEGGFVTSRPKRVYGMSHMCTKGFLNYLSVIVVFLKVVFKDEIIKFS